MNKSNGRGKGFVLNYDIITKEKLKCREIAVSNCSNKNICIELFAGRGNLTKLYNQYFNKVITVDSFNYENIDYNMKALCFIKNELSKYDFNYIDFDDEGCPMLEVQEVIKNNVGKKYIISITDGMSLNFKCRGSVNLYKYYKLNDDTVIKINDNYLYRNFEEVIIKGFNNISNFFKVNIKNLYLIRDSDYGNTIYSCWLIDNVYTEKNNYSIDISYKNQKELFLF